MSDDTVAHLVLVGILLGAAGLMADHGLPDVTAPALRVVLLWREFPKVWAGFWPMAAWFSLGWVLMDVARFVWRWWRV